MNVLNNSVVTTGGQSTVYTPGILNVGAGTTPSRVSVGGDLVVNGTVNYNSGTLSAAGTLAVGGNVLLSNANRNAAGTASNKKLLEVGVATLTSTGVIDLNDNDMLIHNVVSDPVDPINALDRYRGYIKTARNGGLWNMPGITSTAAKNAVPKNKNLGIITGAEFAAGGGSTFDGRTVVATDTLIKYTFNGDTDLNGKVDFDDYSHTDNGFNNHRTGWFNGDFDYNGAVDFDDYSLIDQAFNTQGSVVLNAGDGGGLAGPGARTIIAASADGLTSARMGESGMMFDKADKLDLPDQLFDSNRGSLQAVPEPTVLGAACIGLGVSALRRRRRATN